MYRIEPVGDDIATAIAAMPTEFLAAFSPWSVGDPYNPANLHGSRAATFGPDDRGLVVYAIEDSDRRTVWLWTVIITPDIQS